MNRKYLGLVIVFLVCATISFYALQCIHKRYQEQTETKYRGYYWIINGELHFVIKELDGDLSIYKYNYEKGEYEKAYSLPKELLPKPIQ